MRIGAFVVVTSVETPSSGGVYGGGEAGGGRRLQTSRRMQALECGAPFGVVDISSTISSDWKYDGAAVAPTGDVVFAPLNAASVGVVGTSSCEPELGWDQVVVHIEIMVSTAYGLFANNPYIRDNA